MEESFVIKGYVVPEEMPKWDQADKPERVPGDLPSVNTRLELSWILQINHTLPWEEGGATSVQTPFPGQAIRPPVPQLNPPPDLIGAASAGKGREDCILP